MRQPSAEGTSKRFVACRNPFVHGLGQTIIFFKPEGVRRYSRRLRFLGWAVRQLCIQRCSQGCESRKSRLPPYPIISPQHAYDGGTAGG
jgi:hypothetical protein